MARPPTLLSLLAVAGISASELARRVGVSPNAVSRWISRQDRPAPERVARIAAVLGVPLVAVTRRLAPARRSGRPRKG